MKISICGSITFMDEINLLKDELLKIGFEEVFIPVGYNGQEKDLKGKLTPVEDGKRKIDLDLINQHWHKILKSDCILVANYDKNGIDGYIGGNTLMEMGFAFVTGKPIFLLNKVPNISYTAEIEGMRPVVINNNILSIVDYYKIK